MIDVHGQRPIFRTDIPSLVWPALPPTAGAAMLALLRQFEDSEWWSEEALLQAQTAQLDSLVRHAVSRVPFYSPGDTLRMEAGSALNMEKWAALPVLTRTEVQDNYDALQSREIPAAHGRVSEFRTSGSTGSPVRVKATRLSMVFAGVCSLRAHHWHGRDVGGRLAAVHLDRKKQANYPHGLEQSSWGWPASEVYRTGPAALLSLRTPIEKQVEWLARQDPHYLLSCPSNLLALADYCLDAGVRFPRLRDVATIMEVVTPELREACRRAWDVPVVDLYTTREAGCIAMQCPEHDHYHVMAETCFVEILNERDLPCQPGEIGRVVVTPLHNYAMPLLRYEIGDYAEVGAACPCGRGLPVLRRILGRVRNMLVLPDGRRAWPSFGRSSLVAAAPVRQHQVVQKDLKTLEFRLVVERPLTRLEEESIRTSVGRRLPATFDIEFRYVERLERGADGKFEDFRSEVAPMHPAD